MYMYIYKYCIVVYVHIVYSVHTSSVYYSRVRARVPRYARLYYIYIYISKTCTAKLHRQVCSVLLTLLDRGAGVITNITSVTPYEVGGISIISNGSCVGNSSPSSSANKQDALSRMSKDIVVRGISLWRHICVRP